MKSPAIPEFIDPAKSCDKGLIYAGLVDLNSLPRFLAAQAEGAAIASDIAANAVAAKYSFRRDEQGLRIAELHFSATATLTCQRCLGFLDVPCKGRTAFVFCKNNLSAEQAPKAYEPALLTDGKVNLWQLLEDELLLTLPMFPNHKDERCNSLLNGLKGEAEKQAAASPFAILGELLKK